MLTIVDLDRTCRPWIGYSKQVAIPCLENNVSRWFTNSQYLSNISWYSLLCGLILSIRKMTKCNNAHNKVHWELLIASTLHCNPNLRSNKTSPSCLPHDLNHVIITKKLVGCQGRRRCGGGRGMEERGKNHKKEKDKTRKEEANALTMWTHVLMWTWLLIF